MAEVANHVGAAPGEVSGRARDLFTDDADTLAGSISGWSQRYEQMHAGPFRGRLTEVDLGPARVFAERTSRSLRQICTVPVRHVWFGLPFGSPREVRINGAAVAHDRIAVHRGGVPFELITPDELCFWGVVVDEDVLMDHARQCERESWLAAALRCPVLAVDEMRKEAVQRTCGAILDQAEDAAQGAALGQVRRAQADDSLRALFSLFESAAPVTTTRVSERQRHRIVERADAYVREHSDHPVTVAEICSALSVSRRALQASFRSVMGIGPHAYIRAISLNGVRRHLRDADSPYASVQDAAAAHGFWHMSQFAVDYRRLFGERPSETLRRRARAGAC